MGTYIYLDVSKSVTAEEWADVYKESLELAKNFQLAESRRIKIHGIDVCCLVKVEEYEDTQFFNHWLGWRADGDYQSIRTAECFGVPKNLVDEKKIEPEAGDALLKTLYDSFASSEKNKKFSHSYRIWGTKTGQETYHIYLLAIAAMIENRLGIKAFTHGDIDRSQFEAAIYLANMYLAEPIELPDSCSLERFYNRLMKLPLSVEEQKTVMKYHYLGAHDEEYERCVTCIANREFFLSKHLDSEIEENKKTEYKTTSKVPLRRLVEEDPYDIMQYSMLKHYKIGNTIQPYLMESIKKFMDIIKPLRKSKELQQMIWMSPQEKCEWLVNKSLSVGFLLRDIDWERIFTNIETDAASFERYYVLVVANINDILLRDIRKALLVNNQLYEFVETFCKNN